MVNIELLVTDLDGTITEPGGFIPTMVPEVLKRLGDRGIKRAVATGRSLFSTRQMLKDDFPIDFLIFSCGAGILDWKTKQLAVSHHLERDQTDKVIRHLMLGGFDFMVHKAIPDNHHFYYLGGGKGNADFARRCERNADFAISGRLSFPVLTQSTQFVVVEPPETGPEQYEQLRLDLSPLSVIRTTSPLDHTSTWIEVFATGVCKSQGAQWICERGGFDPRKTMAFGNDYNDIDLLEWAAYPTVVADAPTSMRERFPQSKQPGPQGFLEIVNSHWPAG